MANSGNKYTGATARVAGFFSKIDRVLVNGEWVDQMPDITAHVLPEGISDHCPLMVQRSQPSSKKRSKATWIRQGDDNTKYFFSVIKKRKLIQTITLIRDEQGRRRQDEQAQVTEVFVRYYQQLLGDSGGPRKPADDRIFAHGPTVSAEQQWGLLQPFNMHEIKTAMFSIKANKSPGPDGYGGGFYRAAWDIVGNEVCEAVLEFFASGKILKQINATMITIIPKVEKPVQASQFRQLRVVMSCINASPNCYVAKLKRGLTNNSESYKSRVCTRQITSPKCSCVPRPTKAL
ncbi:uncharacterized protein LOC132043841 [Lycium ferocissimum]|uniref:uncharacterized protein LOC132043841 n=1 Tax=Lycium ferocissimum TaxID=112874 RepID=UPI002814A255|nr:uncharacterized protein LOC132043841 [Lycium ferocissimum]